MKGFFAIGCFAALIGVNVLGQSDQAKIQADHARIQGVWRLVEYRVVGPNMPTIAHTAGLWVFTGKHAIIAGENSGDKARLVIPNDAKATADELRAAFTPFYARACAYELSWQPVH